VRNADIGSKEAARFLDGMKVTASHGYLSSTVISPAMSEVSNYWIEPPKGPCSVSRLSTYSIGQIAEMEMDVLLVRQAEHSTARDLFRI
jgi:hypothetical protein